MRRLYLRYMAYAVLAWESGITRDAAGLITSDGHTTGLWFSTRRAIGVIPHDKLKRCGLHVQIPAPAVSHYFPLELSGVAPRYVFGNLTLKQMISVGYYVNSQTLKYYLES